MSWVPDATALAQLQEALAKSLTGDSMVQQQVHQVQNTSILSLYLLSLLSLSLSLSLFLSLSLSLSISFLSLCSMNNTKIQIFLYTLEQFNIPNPYLIFVDIDLKFLRGRWFQINLVSVSSLTFLPPSLSLSLSLSLFPLSLSSLSPLFITFIYSL
jgi:hypothetical protein